MAGTDFLAAEHPIYKAHVDAWKREERRLFGGDAIIDELFPWLNENPKSLTQRQAQRSYINFPEIHASLLAGHLHSVAPMPKLGSLGDVRARDDLSGKPTVAELIYYNADGIGMDGSQWDAYWLEQQVVAIALGHTWTYVELPTAPDGKAFTQADVLGGQRPYLVPYSPLDVPYWETSNGRLDCAIIRTPVLPVGKQRWETPDVPIGYYVHTRAGFEGFGAEFAGGGWWIFDADKKPTGAQGDYAATLGQIPLVPLFGKRSRGTSEIPALSRSLTTELGNLAVALMNRVSERDYDARDAAKSIKYLMNVSAAAWELVAEHHESNSILVPVPGTPDADGKITAPTIVDGSGGAVASEVFSTIITSTVALAKEIMIRQITSTPDSSGASKQAGFSEATSPLLAGLAIRRETAENAVLAFLEMRAGVSTPSAFVTWPREFDLAPVLSKVERTLKRETDAALVSPLMRADMIERAAVEDGTWPSDQKEADMTRAELVASAMAVLGKQKAEALKLLIDAQVPPDVALPMAGFTPEQVTATLASDGGPVTSGDPTSGDPIPNPKTDPTTDPTVTQ